MQTMSNENGKPILLGIVAAIQANKSYLSEVDGLIGDGDHGMNMNKGFSQFGEKIAHTSPSFTEGLGILGDLLFRHIGGSIGPIYGAFFTEMSQRGKNFQHLGLDELADMLEAGLNSVYEIVDARVGDKTLVDALAPAIDALRNARKNQVPFEAALNAMKFAAESGRDSTKDMVSKYGRSSRLGERSRGVLDAGAVSCCILLTAMADGIIKQLRGAV